MSQPTASGKIVQELLSKFPNAATKSLARKAYTAYPQLWPTLESCRTAFRRYRGNCGQRSLAKLNDKSHVRPSTTKTNLFPKLPPSIKRLDPWEAVQIDTPGEWAIISDVHVPFHDEGPVTQALQLAKDRNVKGILLNGDIADFYRISDHRKDTRVVDFWEEIEAVKEFLDCVRSAFPKARIVYKHGNHEERYINWMMVKAAELLDVTDFSFRKIMKLDDFKIEEVKDKRPIRLGKLWALHGHEFRRGMQSPVNPARGLYMKTGESCLQGDCHRTSEHSEMRPMSRHLVSCWSQGCLCQLDVDYDPLNKWNQGFVHASIAKNGAFEIQNFRIVDGKAYQ